MPSTHDASGSDNDTSSESRLSLNKSTGNVNQHHPDDYFVSSMDFSEDGTYLITTQSSSTLSDELDHQCLALYSTDSGKCTQEIPSQKYGCDHVKFTHANTTVLFASNNSYDHTVRHLDIQNSRFIRYFKGHQSQVHQIAMNPISNHFSTCAKDHSVRFWDLSDPSCRGKIPNVKGHPCLAYDPKGLVLAIAGALNTVRLYDVRKFTDGPFLNIIVDTEPGDFTNLEFSSDGKYLGISTQHGKAVLVDSFDGKKIAEMDTNSSEQQEPPSSMLPALRPLQLSFTPDSKYVLMGSRFDGLAHAWDLQMMSQGKVNEITMGGVQTGSHSTYRSSSPIHLVKWNPKKVMLATASAGHLALWLPDVGSKVGA